MRLHTLDSLQERSFRHFWSAVLLTSSGEWLQQLVVGWMMYEMTRSSLLTTLVLGLSLVPSLLGAPFGGILADRWNRTKVLASAYALQSTFTVSFSALVVSGHTKPWNIFAFVLVMGLLQSVSWPARQAIIPQIVRREHLFNAFAICMLTSSSTRLVVPAAAGLLIIFIGPGATLLAGALMYLTASVIVITIHIQTATADQTQPRSIVKDFFDGVRYVQGDPILFPVILLGAATYTLMVPAVHGLMPVYASEVFNVGPAGLGLMTSALGLGATLGSLFLASISEIKYKGRFMIGCLLLMVLAALSFSHISVLIVTLPFLVLANGGFDTFAAFRSASIQVISPNPLRGRVSAVNQMGSGLLGLGSLLVGVAADLVGAPSTTLIASLIMLVCIICIILQYKQIWTF